MTDWFPSRRGGIDGFDDEGSHRDDDDQQEDDIALQLRLAPQFLRCEEDASSEGGDTTEEGCCVTEFDHAVPRSIQCFWKDLA